MFVPLLVLNGLLVAMLVMLLMRRARLRAQVTALPERVGSAEARAERAIAALHRATEVSEVSEPIDDTGTAEVRTDVPAERRPRRRVRRVGPPVTPDRP